MYNVFTDFHHAGLLQSFILLFEKRFGGNVYRPIGMEWANEGFWKIYDHPATRLQYLTYDQGYRPQDGTEPLNIIKNVQEGVYYCHDIDSDQYNKAISLEKFKEMPIDFVIASIPQHIEPFRRLINAYKPTAKLIYQIGNAWNIADNEHLLVDGIMASTKLAGTPTKPFVEYHQEFDLDVFFRRRPRKSFDITSFVNCFSVDGIFAKDFELFEKVEKLMPNFRFRTLGGQCRDGAAHGTRKLADEMANSRFIWHTKTGGDGYGHIVHNAGAVGRPLIVKLSQYAGKMGGGLMIDGQTVIDIDGLSASQIVEKILKYNEPPLYEELCLNIGKKFDDLVKFSQEAEEIRHFLEMLQ